MKRLSSLLLSLLLMLGLAACGETASPEPEQTIAPAKLTADEANLAQLLGGLEHLRLFDFTLGEASQVQSLHLVLYVLQDGAWQELSSDHISFQDPAGRIALEYDRLFEGLRTALQSEHHTASGSSFDLAPSPETDTLEDCGMASAVLSVPTEVSLQEEIPLVLQAFTRADSFSSPQLEAFAHPDTLAQEDWEAVYAVALRLSPEPLS